MTSTNTAPKSLASYASVASGATPCRYAPRPWVRSIAIHGETGLTHAAIYPASPGDSCAGVPLMVFAHQGTPSEEAANLVAAAPELLAVLRSLLAAHEALDDTDYARAEAAAVALLARLDGVEAAKPESAPLSGEG